MMTNKYLVNAEVIFIAGVIYLFIVISIAKIGSGRNCGGMKAFIFSLIFTPLFGLLYVLSSPQKDTLKITHYRCPRCGLEYTSKYNYCPSCEKDGISSHLEKIRMKTY